MLDYVLRDLRRNPRRTAASVAGVALAVGLFSGIAFFVDSSASQMTARAIAPVTIDMLAGITKPLATPLTIAETVEPGAPLTVGQTVTVTVVATNRGSIPASAVVIQETLSDQLTYVAASASVAGAPVGDGWVTPAGGAPAGAGLNVGTLAPGATVTVSFKATVSKPVATGALSPGASVRSAEYPASTKVGDAPAVDLGALAGQVAAIPDVTAVQPFALVDFPAGSLTSGAAAISEPIKVIAINPAYLDAFPVLHLTAGSFAVGSALLSQPAADLMSVNVGAHVGLHAPGPGSTLNLPLSGIVDISSPTSDPLFTSRNPATEGEVAPAPYVLIVDWGTFQSQVLPAVRASVALGTAGSTTLTSAPPLVELHVAVSHDILAQDPGAAIVHTRALRRTVERLAPGAIKALDNLSGRLSSVQGDATLAKVLFLFLGLPGVLLAAYLSRYAGSLLADAQRRERALLRARGFPPTMLLRALAYNSAAVAILGAGIGLLLGLAALAFLFGGLGQLTASAEGSAISVGVSLLVAIVTTALGLYLPARRALADEVAEERREVQAVRSPFWLRVRLDFVLLAIAAVVGGITFLSGGYKPSGAEGQTVSLSFYVLLAPLCFWLGASLLAVRVLLLLLRRLPAGASQPSFRHGLVARALSLGVRRRPQAVASGVIALSLAVAFGASLTMFLSTYQNAKLTDARFATGGDVRVTRGASGAAPGTPAVDLATLVNVPGARASTALARGPVIVGTDRRSLGAIDPATFGSVAMASASSFNGTSPAEMFAGLAQDPKGALISADLARTFDIAVGDPVNVQLTDRIVKTPAPGTPVVPTLLPYSLHAVGIFTTFPGFPQGVDLIVNLAPFVQAVHAPGPDMYMVASDGTDEGTSAVAAAIRAKAPPTQRLVIETSTNTFNAGQSSLSAINVNGLGRLEVLYTIALSGLGIAIFVFGLLLQRSKEHVTLRALGIRLRQLQALVLGEAALVAIVSLVIGGLVGTAMAPMFVQILAPLFIVVPEGIRVPLPEIGAIAALILGVTLVSAIVAATSLGRGNLVGILREE